MGGVNRAGGPVPQTVVTTQREEETPPADVPVRTNRGGWTPPAAGSAEVERIAPRRESVVAPGGGPSLRERSALTQQRADDRFARDMFTAGARNSGNLDGFASAAGGAVLRRTLDSPGQSGERLRDELRDRVPVPVQAGIGAAVVAGQLANGERVDVLNTRIGPVDVGAETNFRGDSRVTVGTTVPLTRDVGLRVRADTDGDSDHSVRAELVLRPGRNR